MNKEIILEYINKCVDNGFPFPNYNISISEELNKLRKCDKKNSNIAMKIIYNYHPSIWLANKKGCLSPFSAWQDISKLYQCIENRLKYKGEQLTPNDILYGFSASHIAPKVSVFKPALAKYLIAKYLNQYSEIFDPCCGYSGRLLGSYVMNKKYIGQDINSTTITEINRLVDDLKLEGCSVFNKNSICNTGKYECLFTCSPYSGKENWGQSIEDLSCDEWIDICLKNYCCKAYLFVVDHTCKYREYIVEEIINRSHFSASSEKVILINNEYN